jgi:hypothetical protein
MITFKRDRTLIEYARHVIDLYEDHDRSKDDTNFHILELELDMALSRIELEFMRRKMEDMSK